MAGRQPGLSAAGDYTQALVDGFRIVLRVKGQEVSYHGPGKPPFRCDNPDPNGAGDAQKKQ